MRHNLTVLTLKMPYSYIKTFSCSLWPLRGQFFSVCDALLFLSIKIFQTERSTFLNHFNVIFVDWMSKNRTLRFHRLPLTKCKKNLVSFLYILLLLFLFFTLTHQTFVTFEFFNPLSSHTRWERLVCTGWNVAKLNKNKLRIEKCECGQWVDCEIQEKNQQKLKVQTLWIKCEIIWQSKLKLWM